MKKVIRWILALVLVLVLALAVYLGVYEHPTEAAVSLSSQMESDDQSLWFEGTTGRGYLIYPGGKVDERAYAPFAKMLAGEGDTVVIAKMPFRLAIFHTDIASDIIASHPSVTEWVLVGHSLGGTAASMYVSKHPQNVSGLCFLASYSYSDLSALDLWCLSFLGEKDGVLNQDAYQRAKPFFPVRTVELVIAGGNHSNFGSYGLQRGDNEPDITADAQQAQVAESILHPPSP